MATQSKSLPVERISHNTRRIAELAEKSPLAEARRWFARERAWMNEHHLQLCRIPASTFFEQQRAEWFRARLDSLGWTAKLDRAGNVLATFGSDVERIPSLVVSAHLDTVFAPGKPEDVYYAPDGRLFGPGVADNGSGLTALLALARLLAESPNLKEIADSILLVANVGEEGEGNLSGMRYLCEQSLPSARESQAAALKAFLVLDGPAIDHITTQALASRRYELAFSGPGGHSWNDYGTPNPVHAVADAVTSFLHSAEEQLTGDNKEHCSYNFGVIEGGTSINSIASSARAKLDLRSEEVLLLDRLSALLTSVVEQSLEKENRQARSHRLTAKIKELGSRPGGRLAERSPLLRLIQAVDAHLHIRSRIDCASTDANVPLSMGLPAISMGAGGQGGGAHTNQEWYQPEGRELGLWRILLLLAALAGEAHADGPI